MADLTFYNLKFFGGWGRGGGILPDPLRGSCLWYSLLAPPTFMFQPSTSKLIENPAVYFVLFLWTVPI